MNTDKTHAHAHAHAHTHTHTHTLFVFFTCKRHNHLKKCIIISNRHWHKIVSIFFVHISSNSSPFIMYALGARVVFRNARAAARFADHKYSGNMNIAGTAISARSLRFSFFLFRVRACFVNN